jgi:hypothetical protein
MVVSVATIFVEAVSRHKLNYLQSTLRAVDVRDIDVGLLFLVEWRNVSKQAVGENRR